MSIPTSSWRPRLLSLLALALVAGWLPAGETAPPAVAAPVGGAHASPAGAPGSVFARFGQLPLSFIPNAGQSDPSTHFQVRGAGHSLLFGDSRLALVGRPASTAATTRDAASRAAGTVDPASATAPDVVEVTFPGARTDVTPSGLEPLPGIANFFAGDDPAGWRTNIPTYGAVRYADLYPGIDLVYRGHTGALKAEWLVAPGADPAAIRLAYGGAVSGLTLADDGSLHVATDQGEVVEAAPEVYQVIDGAQVAVASHYSLVGEREVAFALGAYDPGRPLVIDPVLVYSSYLGGSGGDSGRGIAVDAAGNAYIAGRTDSHNFPVQGAYQSTYPCAASCGFVTKVAASGASLVYSTFLGGNGYNELDAIAVDGTGNAYVTGGTSTSNYPTTAGSFGATFPALGSPAVVTKLNAAGNALVYSGFLGSGGLIGLGIAVDAASNAYVTGDTGWDGTLPAPNGFQTTRPPHFKTDDAFLAKVSPDGATLAYSTYVGGSGDDHGYGVAVDGSGNAYLTGITGILPAPSTIGGATPVAFPTTPGALQTTLGLIDAFVVKVNTATSGAGSLVYGTYLGGTGSDEGHGIAVDSAGNAYVTGGTTQGGSTRFPTTASAYQTTPRQFDDAFVTKLNATGTALLYSTFLGGNGSDRGNAIAVDSAGRAYVTGYTGTATTTVPFPLVDAFQATPGGGVDAFVAALDPGASGAGSLLYSSYLGGAADDRGNGIAVDSSGNAYVTGETRSTNFPTQAPFQPAHAADNGNTDAFVSKISSAAGTPISLTPTTTATATTTTTATPESAAPTATSTPVSTSTPTATSTPTGTSTPTSVAMTATPLATSTATPVAGGTASLAGFVYVDSNNNGILDPGEAGVPGARVILTYPASGGGTPSTSSAGTGTSGAYSFAFLPAGTYSLAIEVPPLYQSARLTVGSLGGTVAGNQFTNIVVPAGASGVNYNFGMQFAPTATPVVPELPPLILFGSGLLLLGGLAARTRQR